MDVHWYKHAQNWVRANQLLSEEFLVCHVILPRAIREQWQVDEEKLPRMAALMAVLAVEEFLEANKRTQAEIAADAGISRRAWQKTWSPRCEDLFESLWTFCEQKMP